MKIITALVFLFLVTGCISNNPQPTTQDAANLSGEWAYYNGRGSVSIEDDGNKVSMAFTWSGQGHPRPHYRILAIKDGRKLVGTWKCVSKAVRDCTGKSSKITLLVGNDGNSFTVVTAVDPYKHGWNKKVVYYRKR